MFRTLLISMFLTSTALADTWTVDDDGKADFDNIQAAVDAASDGDEIIVMPGTYTGTGDEVVNMLGKEIWLQSIDGPEVTVIDGEDIRRGIVCNSYENNETIIEGFTITNGYTNTNGAGMYIYTGSLTLENCIFTGNSATGANADGGGMYNTNNSSPTLTNCTFANNTVTRYGGGMHNHNSSPTLTNCVFNNNVAEASIGGGGGGMSNYSSSPTLTNCTFMDNSTTYGGGGGIHYLYNNNSTLTNCTFKDNSASATYGGGGVYCRFPNLTLTNTTVCDNTPDQIYGWWTDNGGNWVADECECLADINGDGYVNVTDLLVVIDQWGLTDSPADINQDGIVDVSDLLIVVGNWGECE